MQIKILKYPYACFDGDEYTVDLERKMDSYTPGDLICYVSPFDLDFPLRLKIAIRSDGSLAFRSWEFGAEHNNYLQTFEKSVADCEGKSMSSPFVPTAEQIDTVNGLFSGRIKFEGLKLAVGATVQRICPIDVKREEDLVGHKIYLA
jgi:hypothetical protein